MNLRSLFPSLFSALFAVAMAVSAVFSSGCGGAGDTPAASIQGNGSETGADDGNDAPASVTEPVQLHAGSPSTMTPAPALRTPENPHPNVVVRTNHGDITLELDAVKAPATVENFLLNYVDSGFYNGTIFHYVDPGFMIAGGGFDEKFAAKETKSYLLNEANNGLKNVRGTIAMTRQPDAADTATSQFFINLADNSSLDHQDPNDPEKFGYCVFGKVIAGMDVVDAIAAVPVADQGDFPKTPVEAVVVLSIERQP